MIPVVDVFAGPGGLNEGFARFASHGEPVFDVVASFEMDRHAVETLKMRSAVRALTHADALYGPYIDFLASKKTLGELRSDSEFAAQLAKADGHVHEVELGPETRRETGRRIEAAIGGSADWVLIGGPPCQAYSLIGRARRTHDEKFADDKKHFLYREYLDILERFRPAVFVMENVKGLLSAGHSGQSMIDRIIHDLKLDGQYAVRSLVVSGDDLQPKDFIIRSEDFGIPQARHRLILLGIRSDIGAATATSLAPSENPATVWHAIGGMPKVVSTVSTSRRADLGGWHGAHALGTSLAQRDLVGEKKLPKPRRRADDPLCRWLNEYGAPLSQHDPRGHMELDLARYAYLSTLAEHGRLVRVNDLPSELRPMHKNVGAVNTPFSDRFKVQRWDRPSSTIASHISKDGHYYIHPDPNQMRSLTVREAARLQTFPDDYWFAGPRTMQYHQVGNAVPPLLAHQIAAKVAEVLGR